MRSSSFLTNRVGEDKKLKSRDNQMMKFLSKLLRHQDCRQVITSNQ